MKKMLLTVAFLMAMIANLNAAPVTKAQALSQAQAFLNARGIEIIGDIDVIDGPRKVSVSREENPYYYVCNIGEDNGFVIVAADDRSMPILAYSEQGNFNPQDLHEGVKSMMDGYVRDIELLDKWNIPEPSDRGKLHVTTPTNAPVQPLVTTQWNQRAPYNNSCPKDKSNDTRCLVGCAGTCAGQLLYFYRDRIGNTLPKAIPGYTVSSNVVVGTIKAGTKIDWAHMYNVFDGSQTSTEKAAVADLLFYAAAAMGSKFATSATPATISKIQSSLVDYFNFKAPQTASFKREAYTYAQWKNMIINELNSGRPVVYCAYNEEGGHAFIIDGYDGGELFHVNFGWGGYCDGYFSLSVLNPHDYSGQTSSVTSDSYISKQSAFFGLQPANGYFYDNGINVLNAVINSVTKGTSSYTAKVTYTNKGSNTGAFLYGLGYVEPNGNVVAVKQGNTSYTNVSAGASTSTVSYSLSASDLPSGYVSGTVIDLRPICKKKGNEDWEVCNQSTSTYVIAVKYVTSSKTFTASLKTLTPSLSAPAIMVPGSCVKGASQIVEVDVKNDGDDYYGNIYLFASTSSSKGSYKSYKTLYIPAGRTVRIRLSFTPSAAGTFNLWVSSNSTATEIVGTSKVTITSGTYTKSLSVSSLTMTNVKSGKAILGTTIKGTAVIKNASTLKVTSGSTTTTTPVKYYGTVIAGLYYKSGSNWASYSGGKFQKIVEIGPNESYDLELEYNDLDVDKTYAIIFKYGEGGYLGNYKHTGYTVQRAVCTFTADGEMVAYEPASSMTVKDNVVAADFSGFTGTVKKVTANKNPNTLYFVASNESTISGLSGKNVVKGAVAEKITINSAYNFATPKNFEAKQITLNYVPSLGAGKTGGWQTLVLPFAATKLTCDGDELEWFKSAKDYGKNLWIKEFSAIKNASTVCFGYAQELEAYKPYLIAVPGSYWGDNNNLVGKTLSFTGQDATIYKDPVAVSGSEVFNFRGVFISEKISNIYMLNSTGTKFVNGTYTVKPFNCYFVATNMDQTDVNDLNIGSIEDEESDGIMMPFAAESEMVDVYNLNGVKVAVVEVKGSKINIDNLPKGVYVIKGKKLIKY